MSEQWRDIPGYEGRYQVSNLGNIKSVSRMIQKGKGHYLAPDKIMKLQTDANGYMYVILDRKLRLVHRLVGLAFIPEPKETINHKNGIKSDNRVENLEWATRSENVRHAYAVLKRKGSLLGKIGKPSPNYGKRGILSKLSKKVCQFKNGMLLATFASMREAERITGINHAAISATCRGLRTTAGGYNWTMK